MSAPFDSRAAAADLSRRATIRVLERAGIDASDLIVPAWQRARAPAEPRSDQRRLAELDQGPDSNQKKDWPRDGETPTDGCRRGSGGAPAPPVAKLSFGAKPPSQRRRSDEEVDRAWRLVAWQAGLDRHAAELATRQFRDTAAATGLDAHALIEDGRGVPRARMLSWLGADIRCCRGKRCACRVTGDDGEKLGLPCDGISRRTRIAHCGSVHPALRVYQDGHREVGLAHWRCPDRWCPVCAADRQSKTAAELRAWCEHRGLAHLAFLTLTQVKLGHDEESCCAALDRLKATQRACFNTKTARGRALRAFCVGGVVFEEVTWSPRGEVRKDGTLVAYDGWHAHIRAIVELAPAPEDLVAERGEREAWVVWRKRAYEALLEAWLEVSVGAVASAQKICDLDVDRIGQVCKYPLKPMEHAHVPAYREAVFAIGGRRMHDAFGSWRGWRTTLQGVARDRASSEHAHG